MALIVAKAAASQGGGNIIDASSASSADVNSAIASASSGDTVRLPASASATWTAAVSLPNTKYIKLDLNGSAITLSGASGTFTINAHATGLNRVTNGTFSRDSGYNAFSGPFKVNDERGMYGVRVDNITFLGANGEVIIDMSGRGPGVMDHCDFTGLWWAQEFIHILGWGAGDNTGWGLDSGSSLAGSAEIFTMEDCTFTARDSQAGVAWIQAYYGARFRVRHCVLDQVSIDAHGTAGNVGARWWEIYENLSQNTVNGTNGNWLFSARAGSGVVHDNVDSVGAPGADNLGFCEEDSGYPALYQIGRGLDQALDPAYVWDNNTGPSLNSCDAPAQSGMVTLNQDLYASARPGYTAYVYPHPLAA